MKIGRQVRAVAREIGSLRDVAGQQARPEVMTSPDEVRRL